MNRSSAIRALQVELATFSDAVRPRFDAIRGNEEQTKTSLVLPFFQSVLGYDVFDPLRFCAEYDSDVGSQKGEKVDYAVMSSASPVILVECKALGTSLDAKARGQLYRYFSVSEAPVGVLTDGRLYRFFADVADRSSCIGHGDVDASGHFRVLSVRVPFAFWIAGRISKI